MATNLKDLGYKVKIKRNNLGLSQEELANRVGYKTKGSIARIEKGERDLPIDKLKLLAKALNTTPEYLVGWDNVSENKSFFMEDYKIKLGENISKFRKERGITQQELADKTGYKSKAGISDIERGKNTVPIDKLEVIAKVLKVKVSQLIDETTEKSKQKAQSNITHFTNDLISLPLFSSISAGYGAIIDNCFIDNEEIEYIPMIQFPNWQHCFAVRVKGDSMCPKICDGDIVVINTQFSIENNQIGAFMIDDEAFLKRKKISNDNTLLLVSNNDNYAPIVVTKDKNFKEIGKLTQIISNNVD